MKKINLLLIALGITSLGWAQSFVSNGPNTLYGQNASSGLNNFSLGLGTDTTYASLHIVSNTSKTMQASIFISDGLPESAVKKNSIIFSRLNTGTGDNQVRWLDGNGNVNGAISCSSYSGFEGFGIGSADHITLTTGGSNLSYAWVRFSEDHKMGVGTLAPSAEFHTVGTVRHEGLPSDNGQILVVDGDGNVYKSTIYSQDLDECCSHGTGGEGEAQYQIEELKKRIDILEQKLAQQSQETSDIRVFPNPTSNELNITPQGSNVQYEILDMRGRVVISKSSISNSGSVNVESLKSGNYTIRIYSDQGAVEAESFIKH